MQAKRVTFKGRLLPYLLLAPQLAVTAVFFLWPAAQALVTSLYAEDAFGLSRQFVGLANFAALFSTTTYLRAIGVTLVFSASVALGSLALGLALALAAERAGRLAPWYRALLIWPYAVAPAVAAILWWFMFNPSVGVMARGLGMLGISWNHFLNGDQALLLVILAATWKQISYNVLFFYAGLQAIPRALIEAAALDGAGPFRRFTAIVWPLLAPTTFFLVVVNITYAFFDTFGIIHATTSGGPGQATTTLVYKVFKDGFVSLDLGSSSAQSVVLLVIVMALTVLQFRHIERKVHY